jgi:hypothetical protein
MTILLYGSIAIASLLLAYSMHNLITHKARTDAEIDRRIQASVPSVENRYRIS